jgi:hypothetical protein
MGELLPHKASRWAKHDGGDVCLHWGLFNPMLMREEKPPGIVQESGKLRCDRCLFAMLVLPELR